MHVVCRFRNGKSKVAQMLLCSVVKVFKCRSIKSLLIKSCAVFNSNTLMCLVNMVYSSAQYSINGVYIVQLRIPHGCRLPFKHGHILGLFYGVRSTK